MRSPALHNISVMHSLRLWVMIMKSIYELVCFYRELAVLDVTLSNMLLILHKVMLKSVLCIL